MLRVFLIILIFITAVAEVVAQDSLRSRMAMTIGMNRMDFFTGFDLSRQKDAHDIGLTAEAGINRTFFQQRFYPRLGFRYVYDLIADDRYVVGPAFRMHYSLLNVNKSSGHLNYWQEYYLGYYLSAGNKWRFVHSISGGLMMEHMYNSLRQAYSTYSSLGFSINFGIQYVW